jgi:hypothetical protein
MTDGDQREPLWASSLASRPHSDHEADFPELGEEADAPPPADEQPPDERRAVAIGVGVLAAIALGATMVAGNGSLEVEDVPSSWGSVPMTCHTARLDHVDRAVELFRCQASSGALPPGVYESPAAQWTSDLTGLDARTNRIVISPDGDLTGWATY